MNRPELTAVNHYNVFPFNHGGSLGIRGLYKALSEWFDVNIITFVLEDIYPEEVSISNHIKVIPICLSDKLKEKQKEMCKECEIDLNTLKKSGLDVTLLYHKNMEIIERVGEISKNSMIVLAEHAYTWKIVKRACSGKHLWYRANNVEYDFMRIAWKKIGCPQRFLQHIYDIEKECCVQCERILTVSQLDIDRFIELYKLPKSFQKKFIDIHSGYDIDNLKTVIPGDRKKVSEKYSNTGFFITSYSSYGQSAVENCIEIAKELPDIQIIIAGNIYREFKAVSLPVNVIFTGIISDEEKMYYLQHCDFALNLLEAGAGINVKMFEYFAFGIPVITTIHGARGILVTAGKNCILTEKGHYVDDIKKFCSMPLQKKNQLAQNALELLKKEYSWRSLGCKVAEEIENIYGLSISGSALPLEEIALYEFTENESYLPKKTFYIRCAGEYGKNCFEFMCSNGLKPKAFIDERYNGLQGSVNGVPVISFGQFMDERTEEEVVVAVSPLKMLDVTAELIAYGMPLEGISLSWDIKGHRVMKLSDLGGYRPCYYSAEKWRREILRRAGEYREDKD